MKEFDNLKAIWDQQNQQVIPDVSHIIDKAEKEKNSIRNKIIIQVLALSIAMIVMCVVLCMINFKMTITLILGILFFKMLCCSTAKLKPNLSNPLFNILKEPSSVTNCLTIKSAS